jgi:hypothetical protein
MVIPSDYFSCQRMPVEEQR